MQQATWMARKFGPAASTIALATKAGAVLGGIWITAKGTSPTIVAYDATASVAASAILPSHIPAALGLIDLKGIGCGTGLTVLNASCSGVILFQPSNAGA